jgi:hypothetical protein
VSIEPGLLQLTALDTVRLEGAPPQSADVNNDAPIPLSWGDSVIAGGEIPVIVGTARAAGRRHLR